MTTPPSLWWASLDESPFERAQLSGDLDVDVVIVGGGFTGLWTARELLRRDPSLDVVVLERETAGFGASGRNGGWASALYPVGDEALLRSYGLDAYHHLRCTLQDAVEEMGQTIELESIDAHYLRGGSIVFARSELQDHRLRVSVNEARERDVPEGDLRYLEADEAKEYGKVTSIFGATYTPHCARIHPARLVRGLASAVERHGGRIFERSGVTRIVPANGRQRAAAVTPLGVVRADVVVRATEGFTPQLPGSRRDIAPLYSLMVATEPLSKDFWSSAGFGSGTTFADDRHLIIYGQRTFDDRIAFGGRGAPYHFASSVEPRYDQNQRVFGLLTHTLRELFPDWTGEPAFTWGGPLGMPRDLSPSVHLDRDRGVASAGGYTGDGVVLSYVAANALADLIVDRVGATAYSTLPFVQRRSRHWEIEPLRWAGINAGLALATRADHVEERRLRTSRASGLLDRLFDQFPP